MLCLIGAVACVWMMVRGRGRHHDGEVAEVDSDEPVGV